MMTTPDIRIDGDRLRVRFDRFGTDAYKLFLKVKRLPEYTIDFDDGAFAWEISAPARFAAMLGVEQAVASPTALPINPALFDDQRAIVEMFLQTKRFACWSDCGLGKTLIMWEAARQVTHLTRGGRVLIVTLNDVVGGFIEEGRKFYGDSLPIVRIETREELKEWAARGPAGTIGITNYEKFNHKGPEDQVVNELRHLAGLFLDESSRLKAGGGKQKWALIKSGKGIEYKLSCTATPAPNEIMEFASQASFLEKMRTEADIIWTYFRRDEKTHRWTVKEHARKAFFEFMASWSIYVRDPRKYGWRKNIAVPPDPQIITHEIDMTSEQRSFVLEHNTANLASDQQTASMFADEANAITVQKLSQAAKGFVYTKGEQRVRRIESRKPAKVAQIVREEMKAGRQVLVWTEFDAESEIVADLLSGKNISFEVLTGKVEKSRRPHIIETFRQGRLDCLITRADMLGFGQNFQNCKAMVFSGWSFSFEDFYQACRRAWRFGQTASVRIHIPMIRELEGQMFDAIDRKERQYEESVAEMEANYIRAMKDLRGIAASAA